ncbi:hypothetical protein OS493_008031 [Desmophyllum pertusum]|uniref:Uncharacterized protein n=1 Tax=Desmophyllum pertusum TaxID=174260 RepID=A0A9W9YI49_9CNID|nr:hypothetical protein OS493_008031 [Desmophyllum pertusum]
MKPKTCPMVTINWEALEGLPQDYRIASRLAMIPFVAGPRSPNGLQAQLQAEEMAKVRLAEAPRALGALLSIDMSIVLQRTNEIKLIIAEDCPDIDDRVLENYSLLLSMGEEIIDIVNDEDIVKTEMLEQYFHDTMYPLCIKRYQTKHGNAATPEDGGPFIISLIMNGLHCEALTRGKLLTCINPNITFTLKTPEQGEKI